MKELTSLAGVGRKVANVVLAECFNIPAFPVDTHVSRVARRLGMVKPNATVLQIEKRLKEAVPKDEWLDAHHAMIFFGRYQCTAKNPKCTKCPLLPSANMVEITSFKMTILNKLKLKNQEL